MVEFIPTALNYGYDSVLYNVHISWHARLSFALCCDNVYMELILIAYPINNQYDSIGPTF